MLKRSVFVISIFLFLAVSLILFACGCRENVRQQDEPTDAPNTYAPVVTDGSPAASASFVPSDVFTPEPSFMPTPEPLDVSRGYALSNGVPLSIDLDSDGIPDTVLFTCDEGKYDNNYTVVITLGSDTADPYTYPFENAYEGFALIADCSAQDGRLEVIACYSYDSNDSSVVAYRVSPDGKDMEVYTALAYLGHDDEGFYVNDGLFVLEIRTDIFGTNYVTGSYTVSEKGFILISSAYTYPESWFSPLTVINDMPAKSLNENGEPDKDIVIKKGTELIPCVSDLSSYVIVTLRDGSRAYVEIETRDDDWSAYICGQPQDHYMRVPYAD